MVWETLQAFLYDLKRPAYIRGPAHDGLAR